MNWIVFSYSLPTQGSSSPRVTLWRRLRRLGAIAPAGSVYILPARAECIEAFQWLAQEIQQAGGQALVMHVPQFEGLTDAQLMDLFRQARQEDYSEIEEQATQLELTIQTEVTAEERAQLHDTLAKLQRQYADLARIDYFDSPTGSMVAAKLANLARALTPSVTPEPEVKPASLAAYQDKHWVTRPQPHVDRLACAWLIRRFINPQAVIRYSLQPKTDEVAFDMDIGEFGHQGPLCTFETMLRAFQFNAPGLATLSEIVHEVDLHDERYFHPEAIGLEAILRGWLALNLSDAVLEAHGIALFDGLFETLSGRAQDFSAQ